MAASLAAASFHSLTTSAAAGASGAATVSAQATSRGKACLRKLMASPVPAPGASGSPAAWCGPARAVPRKEAAGVRQRDATRAAGARSS